jgi:cytochrome c
MAFRFVLPLAASLAATTAVAQPAPPAIWNQCRACHQVGETARNGVGPILNGIFGRRAGTREGFNYSQAYRTAPTSEKTWDEENFRVYIRNPMQVTPGTRMVFAGVRDEAQIDQLIAFLKSYRADGTRAP